MGVISCSYVTPLRIVALCFMVVAFVLHAVGFSSKKWDGIDMEIYGHQYDAYQNLWSTYDVDIASGTFSIFGRVETSIPAWKMNIIYLETTGLGLAVFSSLILLLASFVNRISQRRKIQVTMIILAIIGCLVAAGESITGVKLYQDQYRFIIGINGKAMMDYERENNNREVYAMTWAPYMCMGAGGTYAITAVLLIIDLICAVAKGNTTAPIPPTKE